MGICAYCDRDTKLTREELFPKFLQRRTPSYGTYIDHGRPEKPPRSVPVVRDVCTTCNNQRLGALDKYAATLTSRYFGKLLEKPVEVNFHCDSDQLLRWLLKLLFNDARASGLSTDVYIRLRPFILGGTSNPGLGLSLLAGLIEPFSPAGSDEVFYPEHHGYANFEIGAPASHSISLFRGVFLNSFVFYVVAWRLGLARPTRKRFLKEITNGRFLTELPRPACSTSLRGACMSTEALMRATFDGTILINRT
jgi:hypothetical protein